MQQLQWCLKESKESLNHWLVLVWENIIIRLNKCTAFSYKIQRLYDDLRSGADTIPTLLHQLSSKIHCYLKPDPEKNVDYSLCY